MFFFSRSSAGALAWWRMLSATPAALSRPACRVLQPATVALFDQALMRLPQEAQSIGQLCKVRDRKTRFHMQAYKAIWTDPMSHAFDRQRRCNTSMEPPRQGLFGFCSDLAHVWHVHNVPMYGKFSRHAGQTQIQQGSRIPQKMVTQPLSRKNAHSNGADDVGILPLFRKRYHLQCTLSERLLSHQTFDTNHSGAFLRFLPAAASQYVRIWRPQDGKNHASVRL